MIAMSPRATLTMADIGEWILSGLLVAVYAHDVTMRCGSVVESNMAQR